MLLESSRHSDLDLRQWAIWEAQDARYLHRRRARLARLADGARQALVAFLEAGDAYVSVSWGKDSVVTAHLARAVDPTLPLVRGRFEGREVTDTVRVSEAFLDRWPMPYHVHLCPWDDATWGGPLQKAHGSRRITGIRAEESADRRLSAATHGGATARVCRPVLRWSLADVMAYAYWHDLPLHPVYAMSMDGRLPRRALRVGSIGDSQAAERGRADWERRYYPEVSRAIEARPSAWSGNVHSF